MGSFRSATVLVPLLNETFSFKEVIDVLCKNSGEDIEELLVVVGERTAKESLEICESLERKLSGRLRVKRQKLPYLGGAIREGFEGARGSHVLVIYSDGEADPATVPPLIAEAKRNPNAVISASRWVKGGEFLGYEPLRLGLNRLGQRWIAALYGTKVTDFTFGFRIYPTDLVRSILWEETRHPFVLESILKPLRLGTFVVEIPTVWRSRREGRSGMTTLSYLPYLWTALKFRCLRRSTFLRQGAAPLTVP